MPLASAIDETARALHALRSLGFAEREALHALHEARAHVGIEKANRDEVDNPTRQGHLEGLIRDALDLLTRNRWEKASEA